MHILLLLVCSAYIQSFRQSAHHKSKAIGSLRARRYAPWQDTAKSIEPSIAGVAKEGAWMPIGDVKAMDASSIPMSIEVAGQSLVVWQNPQNSEWSVMYDVCPHRLAPLSEGRVDSESGCIECPYHGWQFKTDGECATIPQMEAGGIKGANTASKVVKTRLTGDMLWAFMPIPGSYYPKPPEEAYPELHHLTGWTTRALPYSFDFLVENFMDPGHIPFAHHSLQGVRSDGSPIPMERITSLGNTTHCELTFTDKIRNKTRDGTVSFQAPVYYHFRVPDKHRKGVENKILTILAVPVGPGRSRVHLSLSFPPDKTGKRRQPIPSWVPLWFIHGRSNNFLDSDIWVYHQERNVRGGTEGGVRSSFLRGNPSTRDTGPASSMGYVLPTSSDLGAAVFRKWWATHLAKSPVFGPTPFEEMPSYRSRSDLTDRYTQHTKDCVHCRTALERAEKYDHYSKFALLAVLALFQSRAVKLAGVFGFGLVQVVVKAVRRATLGPGLLERTSAAQFAESNGKKVEKAVPKATTAD